MAFGLFKKTKKADIIIYNGVIMTQNPDLPAAEAAAIRDGLIIALGDSDTMEDLRRRNRDDRSLRQIRHPGPHRYLFESRQKSF